MDQNARLDRIEKQLDLLLTLSHRGKDPCECKECHNSNTFKGTIGIGSFEQNQINRINREDVWNRKVDEKRRRINQSDQGGGVDDDEVYE